MEYITMSPNSCYNPDYFNLLEQMEYELLLAEHIAITEAFSEILEDAHEVNDVQKSSAAQKLGVLKNRMFGKNGIAKGQTFFNRINQYFTIIINKIKEIGQKFMGKVNELFKLNDKFIKEKLYLLKHVDGDFWKTIEITTYPYKKGLLNDNIYGIFGVPEVDAKNKQLQEMLSENITKDEFVTKHFEKIERCKGPKDGLNEGAKNFFRGINGSEAKMTKYTGDDAKDKCIDAIDYLANYKTSTAQAINNHIKNLEGAMTRAKKDFETDKTNEYMAKKEAYTPVDEGQQKVDATRTQVSDADGINHGGDLNKPGGENNTGSRVFAKMKEYGNIIMLLHTAQMTVAEEYYYASLAILKSVYSKADKQGAIHREEADKARQQETIDKNNQNIEAKKAMKFKNNKEVVNAAKNNG